MIATNDKWVVVCRLVAKALLTTWHLGCVWLGEWEGRWYVSSPGLVVVLVMLSSPVVVRVVLIVHAHRHPLVLGSHGPSLSFVCGCGRRLPSLWSGGGSAPSTLVVGSWGHGRRGFETRRRHGTPRLTVAVPRQPFAGGVVGNGLLLWHLILAMMGVLVHDRQAGMDLVMAMGRRGAGWIRGGQRRRSRGEWGMGSRGQQRPVGERLTTRDGRVTACKCQFGNGMGRRDATPRFPIVSEFR